MIGDIAEDIMGNTLSKKSIIGIFFNLNLILYMSKLLFIDKYFQISASIN